ncbi:MAG TPA: hypothetical protein VE197_20395 [Mycobacterium sp.]|nr:hypothetical protein [Mycobacterium sp.]
MSKSAARQRLYTPLTLRVVAPRVDPEAVGQLTESVARFFGTGRYLLLQTVVVAVWIVLYVSAVSFRWDPYPQSRVLDPGRIRRTVDSAGAKLAGKPRPRCARKDVVAPSRLKLIPNIWPGSWPRCGWYRRGGKDPRLSATRTPRSARPAGGSAARAGAGAHE